MLCSPLVSLMLELYLYCKTRTVSISPSMKHARPLSAITTTETNSSTYIVQHKSCQACHGVVTVTATVTVSHPPKLVARSCRRPLWVGRTSTARAGWVLGVRCHDVAGSGPASRRASAGTVGSIYVSPPIFPSLLGF